MHSKDVLNMEKTLNTYSIFKIQPFELKNSCNKLYFDIQYFILSTYKSHFHLFYCEVLPEKRPTRHFSEGAHDGRFWRFGLQCNETFLFVKLAKLRSAQQLNSCECCLKCTFLRCCQEKIASSILVCLSYILLHLCSSAG